MTPSEYISLKRDVQGIAIPSGQDVTLYAGTEVRITQALGGAFTVMTHMSQLASIAGKDADALGLEIPVEAREEETALPVSKENIEKQVWKKLKTCFDPEIPHNIVDLGLVYACDVSELSPEEGYKVEVKMTLTAPGCGMGDVLTRDAQQKIAAIPGVKEASVALVFEPAWTPAKMNPVLRREFL